MAAKEGAPLSPLYRRSLRQDYRHVRPLGDSSLPLINRDVQLYFCYTTYEIITAIYEIACTRKQLIEIISINKNISYSWYQYLIPFISTFHQKSKLSLSVL